MHSRRSMRDAAQDRRQPVARRVAPRLGDRMKRRAFVQGMTIAGVGGRGRPARRGLVASQGAARRVSAAGHGWRFLRGRRARRRAPGLRRRDAGSAVTLPHTARIEALVTGAPGRPSPSGRASAGTAAAAVEPDDAGHEVLLRFEGAMNVAEVWLDGERVGGHLGGYLPFVLDLTERVRPGARSPAGRAPGQPRQSRSPAPSRSISSTSTCTTACTARCT